MPITIELLPFPLGPMSATQSPSATSKHTS